MLVMFYLLIGFAIASLLLARFLLTRMQIANVISVCECRLRFVLWVTLWPLTVVMILKNQGVSFLFEEVPFPYSKKSIDEALEQNQNELRALWDSPPLCGQQIFARGVNESLYEYIPSTFIFDSAELTAWLANDPLSHIGAVSDEAAIARWLQNRDPDLQCATRVPHQWSRISCVIQKVVDQGVGQAFCPTCQKCYLASHLVKPVLSFKAGWNFNEIRCPKEHLLHCTKVMHILKSH